ncbi:MULTISPECIES: sulfite exporter TauE/SafE family protein [Flavobacteriaceae]|uniref:sulfite exporter TauE/SafE family protein n=1 Tax=Flavobacteriaceae TaxID=49546 RepID=UPI0014913159|nr:MULTISPECIES: sulfite exporter TauE/SafE family protein [Allomuricauda]MDC6367109.1 sulfite exporter TauE/SafE family protein [Muricauda sp. AC10]
MLASAIVLGLLGSLHCLGMCGPIAFMLPLDRKSKSKKLLQLSIYHFGRALAYGIMGLVFGFVGKGLYLFGFQQKLSILIGAVMILLVVIPAKYVKKFSVAKPVYGLLSKIKSRLGAELQKKTPDTFLTIGFLNGFLPCGLVYMALLGAIALGNPLEGGLYMILFGMGTVPLMTSAVYFSSFLKGNTRQLIQKFVPVFVVIIGALFILRGLGLGIPYVSPKAPPKVEMASSNLECH